MNIDINKQIKESTDIEYLIQLEKYVDMDISNIGNDSEKILQAEMYNTTPEKYIEKQKKVFNNFKKLIQNRIKELS